MRNLMLMVSKSKTDLNAKLARDMKGIKERKEALADPEVAGEDIIQIKTSKPRENTLEEANKELLQRLKKYNVDPVWLRDQRTS
jgi:hypothetical protein